ncbi:hypothetical protein [Moraxella sp. ZY200743]|uniref:hypothetical protein n=1 Tax=Moraxella sp. ZY200743 TaxID=2911970 RepID=UPI003D7DCB04
MMYQFISFKNVSILADSIIMLNGLKERNEVISHSIGSLKGNESIEQAMYRLGICFDSIYGKPTYQAHKVWVNKETKKVTFAKELNDYSLEPKESFIIEDLGDEIVYCEYHQTHATYLHKQYTPQARNER